MKRIARSICIPLFFLIAAGTAGCTKDTALADASAPSHETLVVPAGTRLIAVLQTRLSTDANITGDPFVALTAEPVIVGGLTAVPAGARKLRRSPTPRARLIRF